MYLYIMSFIKKADTLDIFVQIFRAGTAEWLRSSISKTFSAVLHFPLANKRAKARTAVSDAMPGMLTTTALLLLLLT